MVSTLNRIRGGFERLLEFVVMLLMIVLALEVTIGTAYRTFGAPLVWYDEVASILLAWLTYYGSALAALKRAHIGFPGLLNSLRPALRLPLTVLSELLVFAFFALLGWVGWRVLDVLATDTLVTLPEITVQYTQSVIPISSVLFIIAEALTLPAVLRRARDLTGAQDPAAAALETTH